MKKHYMKKTVITLSLVLAQAVSIAQPLEANARKDFLEKFKEETLYVRVGQDKEYDDALKFAFNKYWKFNPVKYVEIKDGDYKAPKNVWLSRECEELWNGKQIPKHPSTTFNFGLTKGISRMWFMSYFDDYKNEDEFLGGDESALSKNTKLICYIMCLSAEIKRMDEWGIMKYHFHKGLKETVKDFTVIIPKETIANGRFSESLLKSYFTKCEFLSYSEINAKIKDDKDLNNKAIFCLGRSIRSAHVSIIDLKTGDLLYVENEGLGKSSWKKNIGDEDIKALLKNLEMWNKK